MLKLNQIISLPFIVLCPCAILVMPNYVFLLQSIHTLFFILYKCLKKLRNKQLLP